MLNPITLSRFWLAELALIKSLFLIRSKYSLRITCFSETLPSLWKSVPASIFLLILLANNDLNLNRIRIHLLGIFKCTMN